MCTRFLKKSDFRDKLIRSYEGYLALSDHHTVSIGIYARGELYIFDENENYSVLRYDMGSVSKTVTAHLVLSLADEGKLSVDDSVDKYLKLKKGRYPTIRELLTHTAGYSHLTPLEITLPRLLTHRYAKYNLYEKCTDATVVHALERRNRSSRANRYGYSDFAFAILALVAKEVSGKPLGTLYREFIKDRLGLESTDIAFEDRTPPAVVDGKVVDFWHWSEDNPYVGGGGLVTSLEDMLSYIKRQIESNEPFITAAHEVQTSSFSKKSRIGMCLGWHTYKKSDQLWHVGGVGSFRSSIIINKRKKLGVVVLGNGKGKSSANVHYLAKMIYSELKLKKINLA